MNFAKRFRQCKRGVNKAAAYENHDLVNSFYAIRVDKEGNRIRCEPDEQGNISVSAGDVLRFVDPRNPDKYVAVNSLVFFTSGTPLKVQIGDNELYPLYIGANERRGIEKMRVKRVTILSDATFYYEGMTA